MVEYRCPSCKHTLTEQGDFFPFCSQRCKLQDLGAWASGAYAVPGKDATDEELSSAVRGTRQDERGFVKKRDTH